MSEDKYISRSHRIANNETLLLAFELGNIVVRNDKAYSRWGKPLKERPNFWGYPEISVKIRGRSHTFYLHKVIWVASNGIVPNGFEIDHKDQNKRNYKLSNLQLLTPAMNLELRGVRRTGAPEPAF